MSTTAEGLVPLLNEDGRFPDSFAPPSVAANSEAAQTAAETAQTAAETAQELAQVAEFLLDQRGNVSGTVDLTGLTRQSFVHMTLTGATEVIPPSNPVVGMTISLEVTQDSAGGWPLTIRNTLASFGVAIVVDTTANALSEVLMLFDGVRWKARVGGLADSIPTSWVV